MAQYLILGLAHNVQGLCLQMQTAVRMVSVTDTSTTVVLLTCHNDTPPQRHIADMDDPPEHPERLRSINGCQALQHWLESCQNGQFV